MPKARNLAANLSARWRQAYRRSRAVRRRWVGIWVTRTGTWQRSRDRQAGQGFSTILPQMNI
jgi:hypothetical protein